MVNTDEMCKDWFLDSGCSFHMCPNKSWFESLELKEDGSVLLGNNKSCRIPVTSRMRLRLHDGSELILTEIKFIPELRRNLISLGTLKFNGCWFKSENGTMKILIG